MAGETITIRKGGRPKGSTTNKNSLAMREIMRLSLSRIGGAKAMVKFYNESPENRRTFWGIAGRMLPLEVSGPGGEALKVDLSWTAGRNIGKVEVVDAVVREVATLVDGAAGMTHEPMDLEPITRATDYQSVTPSDDDNG
jgi:hypothetical protein